MAERHQRWIRCAALLLCAVGAIAGPASARAEDAPAPEERLTRAQLKELVGPVALYPDGVLASLLPATTFPLDVIAAARWVEEKGGKVEAVPEDRDWDASVIALLQFPDVLTWLNENLAWMDQMGRAVAAQQAEVLQAIQDFRREVQAAGNLPEGEHLVVKEEQAQGAPEGTTVLVIEPANPQVVYVPIYDPVYVIRPAYPGPLYGFSLGFGFGAASFWGSYDLSWGWWNPWNNFGWYGGIYYSPYVRYWGQPRPYGSWSGPDRPRHWTSQYYPPRHDGHHASIARPTTVRPVYDETRRGAARTGVRPPTRTRLDGGLRTT
ncbi:MAG TPA: DUF3300 domain-containing protein, partial [Planctomycetota bacterium]|nr:DUF3300 domain-containing protein [Planctomycetota bacterium]